MSNFPFAWWDKTITIFNRYVDPTTQRISWYKTIVEGCFWKNVNNTYTMGRFGMSTVGVQLETKAIICRIPKDERYLDKKVWRASDEKAEHFTLANGDIIILGEVEDTIDEYVSGQRATDLIAKYKEDDACLEIETYVDNVRTGVSLEHYKAVGK